MNKIIAIFLIILLNFAFLSAASLDERSKNISKHEMQSIIEFLSHDLLEGRTPGTRGGTLAEIYMTSLFKWMDLKPGFNGQYLQPLHLKGFTIDKLNLDTNGIQLANIDHIIGTWVGPEKDFSMEAEAVFVGFGITTHLWDWNDFKNVDVKDKFIIARVNDPGLFNEKIFEGKALTYFGRWRYHIEEAVRRGAAGILLIHTTETAGYGWQTVLNSWSGEEVFLQSDINNNLKFRGWIQENSLKKLLEAKKIDLAQLYEKSLKKSFKPIPLGFKIKVSGTCTSRDLVANNVIAEIPGKSPKKIVLSAHIDHLGMLDNKEGDNIINGAIDNASAVAAMMLTARLLKESQDHLYYTVVILACHAEEAGMLGSKHYVQTLPDRQNVIANINFESTPVWGKTSDFMAVGGEYSTLEDILKKVLETQGLTYSYFSMTDQGFYFRSDQYPFAQYNIPAVWISAGENDDSGEKKYSTFWKTKYHTVKDEYDPTWPLESLEQTVRITALLIDMMNKTQAVPQWKRKLTFPLEIR